LQAIQMQNISISEHCWNAPSKHKVIVYVLHYYLPGELTPSLQFSEMLVAF